MNITLSSDKIVKLDMVRNDAKNQETRSLLVTFEIPLSDDIQFVSGIALDKSFIRMDDTQMEIVRPTDLERERDRSYLSYPHAAEILKCVIDKYPVSTTDVSAMLGLPYQVTRKTLFLLQKVGKLNVRRATEPNSARWEKIYTPAGVDPDQKKRSVRSFRYAKYELMQDEILEYLKKIQRPTTHREIAKQLHMHVRSVAGSVGTLLRLGKVKPANENATFGTNNYRVVIATYGGPNVEVEKLRKWVASHAEKFKKFGDCTKTKAVLTTTPFILERGEKKYVFLPRLVFRKVIGPGVLINDVTAQLQRRGLILETKSGKIVISVAVPPSKFGAKSITGYGVLIEDKRQQEEKDGTRKTQ